MYPGRAVSHTCGKQGSLQSLGVSLTNTPRTAPLSQLLDTPLGAAPTDNQGTKGWPHTGGRAGSAAASQVQPEHSRGMSEPF